MLKRVITGVVSVAVLLTILALRNWMDGLLTKIAVYLLYLISLHEIITVFRAKGSKPARWATYALGLLLMPAYEIWGSNGALVVISLGTVMALCSAVFLRDPKQGDVVASAFPIVYPTIPFLALFMVASLPDPYALTVFGGIFVSSILSDTFALVVGKLCGKRKLIPSVSPNKTWEGAIGGLAASILFTTLYGYILNQIFGYDIIVRHYVLLGLVGSVATQLGDLVASAIKRFCGTKDFGKLFPGHGGVLDRLDGMLINAIFMYAYYMLAMGGIG